MDSAPSPHSRSVTVRVPAKVNPFLAVHGVRTDGFHELTTVFQSVSLHDELSASSVGEGPGMVLELRQDQPGLPIGADNLAVRAGLLLGAHVGTVEPDPGLESRTVLDLVKRIPVAGGMAGGSADAAAALVALNELWDCGLSDEELCGLGAELGSDVPFMVVGGTALATGRGTTFEQVPCAGRFHWAIWPDEEPLETPTVFRSWDDHCAPTGLESDEVLDALRSGSPAALGAALHNDLEPAAFALRPRLELRKQRLLEAGALGAVLSGSGPTLLALAEDEGEARRLAEAVIGGGLVASSPAGGPRILDP